MLWYLSVPATSKAGRKGIGLQCRRCRKLHEPPANGMIPSACPNPNCRHGGVVERVTLKGCPKCFRASGLSDLPNGNKWCTHCAMGFDPNDDDDGDIGYGSPSRRMERQERQR